MISGLFTLNDINPSIDQARKASWASAVALALVQGEAHDNYIVMMDIPL